jgi:DNA-binding IclR family transcriptional regulator
VDNMRANDDKRANYEIQAISRAAAILELIEAGRGETSLNGLVRSSGLRKPTVFRLVRNLERIGLVERVPKADRYRLGLRCVELGQAYLQQIDFRREALPVLERLRDAHNETVHLAVLDEHLRVVYLEKLEGKHAIGIMMSAVGRSAPAYCTGLGKALLAARDDDPAGMLADRGELEQKTPNTIYDVDALRAELKCIRDRGYALDLEEHEIGVRCVGSTIAGADGAVLAALSIAGPAQRLPKSLLTGELAQATVKAAREIGRRLGAPPVGSER